MADKSFLGDELNKTSRQINFVLPELKDTETVLKQQLEEIENISDSLPVVEEADIKSM